MQRGHALNAACRSVTKGMNPCIYFKNKENPRLSWEPMDIEELHEMGK